MNAKYSETQPQRCTITINPKYFHLQNKQIDPRDIQPSKASGFHPGLQAASKAYSCGPKDTYPRAQALAGTTGDIRGESLRLYCASAESLRNLTSFPGTRPEGCVGMIDYCQG